MQTFKLTILIALLPLTLPKVDALGAKQMTQVIPLDLTSKTVRLNDGKIMPIVGLGTYSLTGEVCANAVATALMQGYRLIDTASIYHNEASIGKALKRSGIPRTDIFITTKLYPSQYANAKEAIDQALKTLDVEYIDLMLLHHPGKYDVEAYRAMEHAVKEGKIRSIGLSCYYIKELKELLPTVTITPAVIQNELHPYYQDQETTAYLQAQGIVVESWYPLGGRGYTTEMLSNQVLREIGAKYGKTTAQVILRWHLQRNIVIIPGSSNPAHQQENLDLFDFSLTAADMEQISQLNRNEKHDWY